MKCLAVVCSLTLLLSGVVHGQAPLHDAVARAVAQQPARPATVRANSDLYWGGAVLAGIGGWLLGTGLGMGPASVSCSVARDVTCTEINGNRALYLGSGAALAAAGIVMSAIGGKRVPAPTVAWTPHGLAVSQRVGF